MKDDIETYRRYILDDAHDGDDAGYQALVALKRANARAEKAESRIAALEAQLQAFREAAKPIDKWLKHLSAHGSRRLKDDEYPAIFGCPTMGDLRALMSALKMEKKDET